MNEFAMDLAAMLAPPPEPGAEVRIDRAIKLVTEQMLTDPAAWVAGLQKERNENLKRLQMIIAGALRRADVAGEFRMPGEVKVFLEGVDA